MINGRVNWGIGRLQMFESISAFTARFCILNGISSREAIGFFEKELECQWPPRYVSRNQIVQLATLLDESNMVVENLLCSNADYKNGGYFEIERSEHLVLRYCKNCLDLGYHSVFHEMCFLTKCPFHDESINSVRSESNARGYSQYVQILQRALSLSSSWRHFEGRTDLITDANYGRVVGMHHWLRSTLDISDRYKANIIWNFSLTSRPDHPSTTYAKMQFLNPPNEQVSQFCNPVSHPAKQRESIFRLEVLRLLDTCSIRLSELVWFFNQTLLLSGVMLEDRFWIIEAHGIGDAKISGCKCTWGRTRYDAWRTIYPEEWPLGYLTCPVNVARNELLEDWGIAFGKRNCNDWWKYIQYAQTLEKIGLVESLRKTESTIRGDPGNGPIVRWIANSELTRLIQTILYECFSMQARELVCWLDCIDRGASPDSRPKMEESIDLLRVADHVKLVTWVRQHSHLAEIPRG